MARVRGKTHIAGGIALGYLAFNNIDILNVNLCDEKTFLLATAGLTLGALLPDIDHPRSTITNKVKPIGYTFSIVFKHRGFTHSLLGSIIMTFLLAILFAALNINKAAMPILLKSIYIGIISHILLDMLTPTGVCILYPSNKRYSIGGFRIGGFGELILGFIFLGIAYYSVYYV